MWSDDLACNEFVECVTDYLEQALSSVERARCVGHLQDCEDCAVYLDQLRRTVKLLGEFVDTHVSDDHRGALLRLFRRGNGLAGA